MKKGKKISFFHNLTTFRKVAEMEILVSCTEILVAEMEIKVAEMETKNVKKRANTRCYSSLIINMYKKITSKLPTAPLWGLLNPSQPHGQAVELLAVM